MRSTPRVLTRRGWSLAGAALGLAVAGRLLGTVELWILATGIALLLITSVVWARSRRYELVAHRAVRPARVYVGSDGRVDLTGREPLRPRDARSHRHRQSSTTAIAPPASCCRRSRPARRPKPPTASPRTVGVGSASVPLRCRPRTRSASPGVRGRSRRSAMCSCARACTTSSPRARRAAGSAASVETAHARAQAADGEDFLTLREYEVGDDLRRVHWRSTARVGDLMIRQDEAQWRARAIVVLDTRPDAHDARSFETTVEATASVVDRLARGCAAASRWSRATASRSGRRRRAPGGP